MIDLTKQERMKLNVHIAKTLGFRSVQTPAVKDGAWRYPKGWQPSTVPEYGIPDFVTMIERYRTIADTLKGPIEFVSLRELPDLEIDIRHGFEDGSDTQ
jgi:hypothetical protein